MSVNFYASFKSRKIHIFVISSVKMQKPLPKETVITISYMTLLTVNEGGRTAKTKAEFTAFFWLQTHRFNRTNMI